MGYSAEGREIKNQTVLSETFGSQPGDGRLPSGLIRHLFVFLERMIQTATKTTRDAIKTTIRQRRTSNQFSFFPTHNRSAMTALTERDEKLRHGPGSEATKFYIRTCPSQTQHLSCANCKAVNAALICCASREQCTSAKSASADLNEDLA